MRLKYLWLFAVLLPSCGPGYKDISSPNGRLATIQQAIDYMTAGNCESARNTMRPLYESQYVDNQIRMVYAASFACQAGFSFTSLIGALANSSGSDIWSSLVLSDYSSSSTDGHLTNLQQSAALIRQTALPYTDYLAIHRDGDANIQMILIQASIIATVISPTTFGNAYASSGKKRNTITGLGTAAEKCAVELAVATIEDSLQHVTATGSLTKISSSISGVCGGTCSGNLDPNVCTAVEQALGAAIIAAIDTQWTLGP